MLNIKENCSFEADEENNQENEESLNEQMDGIHRTCDALDGRDKECDMVIKNPDCDHVESKSEVVC